MTSLPPSFSPAEHSAAGLGLVHQLVAQRDQLEDTQRAILNILDDAETERSRLGATERAVLNILEDFGAEKAGLQDAQTAVLNVLDDLETEKRRLELTQQEVVRSELTARASLHEKEVLLKEVHHRVKNNLQVISSLLNLQARSLSDPGVKAIFSASQNRIQAIALVHEKLYRSASLSHIDFADHIVTLVDGLFRAYDASEHGVAREYDLSGPRLAIDLAIPCGLIVNELVSNCLKHAFRGKPSGLIRIAFRQLGAEQLELTVEDDGVGLPAGFDPTETRSLGLDLVSTFAEQIGASMAVDRRSGTMFRLTFSEHGPNE